MLFTNREINLILTWSANCIFSDTPGTATFKITEKKLLEILSIQGNSKPLQQLKIRIYYSI